MGAQTQSHADERLAAWEADVKSRLAGFLGTTGLADIELLPSGTDGLLLCSILLCLEAGDRPMTAILPAAAETGTGVPRAAARQAFDLPSASASVAGTVQIALRTPDGEPRDTDAVSADFARAAQLAPGRPVITLTYGSKTGLVAPLRVPRGAEVVVDACQMRLSPSVIRACLRAGWPVVVTGSKYLGGPPFSGAVLLPSGRFSRILGKALACWRRTVRCPADGAPSIGPLLRWAAATEGLGDVRPQSHVPPISEATAALSHVRGLRLVQGPTEAMNDAAGGCPGIISFAVSDLLVRDGFLSADRLRPLHRSLADRGVLLGQPVDIGPFGALRLAFGLRDEANGRWHQDLARVAAELAELLPTEPQYRRVSR
jgi:hypothetical protein